MLGGLEQRLFGRLSVFAGSWTLEAAEVICSGNGLEEGSILDLLARLVDKSLVVVEVGESEARYRLLEPIRQYARERLTVVRAVEEMQRRHAEYYLAQARAAEPELTGQQQVMWLERLELEHDNLRAALGASIEREWELGLRLSAALWRFWYMRGYLSEGRRWLEEGLARNDVMPLEVQVKALDGAGWLSQAQGDYSQANALYWEQLTFSRELEDEGAIARSMGNLGSVAISQGDQERATEFLEESLTSLRKLGRKKDIVSVLTDLGTLASAQGELARAIALFEEALALSREVGDVLGVAVSMGNLGLTALAQGDHRLATPLLEESLALFREVGDKQDIAIAVIYLGFTALSQGDHERATELLCEGLSLGRELDEKPSIAKSLEGLAATAGIMGQGNRTARLWGAAQALREDIKAPLPSHEQSLHEPYVASARLQLGEESWQATCEEGRKMAPDEAAEYALTNTEAVSFTSSPPESPQLGKDPPALTRREWDVATLVAQGLSNREVAARLTISEQTAATHVKRILKKLDLDSRAQLAIWITEQDLPSSDLR